MVTTLNIVELIVFVTSFLAACAVLNLLCHIYVRRNIPGAWPIFFLTATCFLAFLYLVYGSFGRIITST